MFARQLCIGVPKMRNSRPCRRRCAATDSPYGPAPTTAISGVMETDMRRPSVQSGRCAPWCSVGPRAASRERSAVAERLQDPGGGRPKPGRGRVGAWPVRREVRRELWRDSHRSGAFLTPELPLWPGRRRAGEHDGGGIAVGRSRRRIASTTRRARGLATAPGRTAARRPARERINTAAGQACSSVRNSPDRTRGGGIGMTAQPDQAKH